MCGIPASPIWAVLDDPRITKNIDKPLLVFDLGNRNACEKGSGGLHIS
jgi:hypothetical protein